MIFVKESPLSMLCSSPVINTLLFVGIYFSLLQEIIFC